MATLLFTISVSSESRGDRDIYSARVHAANGEKLFHLSEAGSLSEALEKVVEEMRQQERSGAR